MGAQTSDKNGTIVVSALNARANFGKLLDRVSDGRHSLVIEKRGTPKAVLLSIRELRQAGRAGTGSAAHHR
jgi:prevent-host-death family protein